MTYTYNALKFSLDYNNHVLIEKNDEIINEIPVYYPIFDNEHFQAVCNEIINKLDL
jgi:hypothetical protein